MPAPGLREPDCGLKVLSQPLIWVGTEPRRAGVSSFGFGGTNVHVLLEQAAESGSRFASVPALPAPQVGYELFLLESVDAAADPERMNLELNLTLISSHELALEVGAFHLRIENIDGFLKKAKISNKKSDF